MENIIGFLGCYIAGKTFGIEAVYWIFGISAAFLVALRLITGKWQHLE